ncbi:MAG: hypothetical protein KIT25_03690 [Enhydrobacter sp.]|nr:MAG: hypothetical protein KIT25_03690 [Enhydrobacter sp.]
MILSGPEIIKQVRLRHIVIDPFSDKQVNPNSYNYRLGDYVTTVHPDASLGNLKAKRATKRISKAGLLLRPGQVYLGHTFETLGSDRYVPSLIGRSSIGRLGLFVQISADLGNLGPAHNWTLELTCVQPIIVYARMIIGQISFWTPSGDIARYDGPYTNNSLPTNNLRNLRRVNGR